MLNTCCVNLPCHSYECQRWRWTKHGTWLITSRRSSLVQPECGSSPKQISKGNSVGDFNELLRSFLKMRWNSLTWPLSSTAQFHKTLFILYFNALNYTLNYLYAALQWTSACKFCSDLFMNFLVVSFGGEIPYVNFKVHDIFLCK